MFRLARSSILRSARLASRPSVLRVAPKIPTSFSFPRPQIRCHSTDKSATIQGQKPELMIAFTCTKCDTRSSHVFSKQSYTNGTVLIQCPGCKNRHLIADNLKIFRDNNVNLEDILKAKGESSLRKTIGHHAKDAPEEFQKKWENSDNGLPPTKE
ncbi:uncharacterized protein CXQ87_004150 [Candidozyma duobushaemuli]|uniref:DNL-type domain-containing protein n=1 Tax=Candidozyma duobushaemuli TaxID=1231522 RepID=A0A2V1AEC3_9ASCO|nr:uncharacterized protein CXQ87_004150 [[Candida] duobushaemulonis]PVH16278.1 hypothetical protein CXQ87_004150 [[Candida] duobushaemulonis]